MTLAERKPGGFDPKESAHLLAQLEAAVSEAGRTDVFKKVWSRLEGFEHRGRLILALNGAKPLRGEGLAEALETLAGVEGSHLTNAVELVRLNMPVNDETLGLEAMWLERATPQHTRKFYINIKTLQLIAQMNPGSLEPQQMERIPGTDAMYLAMMQKDTKSLNHPGDVFREVFYGRHEIRLTPTLEELDRYLLETGFSRDQMARMWDKPQQKQAIWSTRLDELRKGFKAEGQPTLPGIME
jgi:hypothetical protein